jgi:hypothetical protein
MGRVLMRIAGQRIVDDQGRSLILRGCNLGGSSKIPARPEGAAAFKNPAEVSFVSRPFPLEEAEAHLERLREWGFTFLRLVITWEALEHAGPGIYDEAYLAYLRKILLLAEGKGISVFLDPHQDAWSRWTGGDGAPGWTLEKIGIDLDRLDATGAALTSGRYGEFHRGAPYPRMIWPANYSRYAAATLFTLFFGGNTFAPDLQIEGESAQDWLQERYIGAMRHCFRRLKNCKALVGWGVMNEPHPGFIGCRDLGRLENYVVAAGAMPSPLEAMAAASGYPVEVPVYTTGVLGRRITGRETLNPRGLSLFREGFSCPWERAGVWTSQGGSPRLLKRDHFAPRSGGPADFTADFLKPFITRFMARMREADPETLIFIEGLPNGKSPPWKAADGAGVVNAFHWYDGPTLFLKFFRPWLNFRTDTEKIILGRKRVAAYFSSRLAREAARTREEMGDMPCLLGEFGLPFDMNRRSAFRSRSPEARRYRLHEEALSMYYDAVDDNLLHSTIWNYTADNTHESGDGWNGEDLSIFSGGQGRAKGGWLRPYPMATAGTPLLLRWDRKRGIFRYRYRADPAIKAPTEIYAPPECLGERPAIALGTGGGKEAPGFRAEYRPDLSRIFVSTAETGGETGNESEREIEVVVRRG